MNKKTASLLMAVIAAGTLLMTSCFRTTPETGTSDTMYGGDVVVGITQEPQILDPFTVVAAGDKEILFNIYEGLYKFDASGSLNPCLATACDISDDALTYTFTIRQSVFFHNGQEMTPADVVYSTEQAVANMPELSGITSVEQADEDKVRITLSSPDSELLSYFTYAIVPEGYAELDTAPCGTGPFKFGSYDIGIGITLLRNENYWLPEIPYLDSVTFKICADMDSGFIELTNGSIDIFPYLSSDKADQLDASQFTVLSRGSNMVQIFALNNAVAPFDDVRVRQAVNYAVNRTEVIDLTMNGAGIPLTTAMSPVMGDAYDAALDGMYDTDLDAARTLLAEAGYPDGFDMTITVPSNYLIHVNTAVVLADELSQIGINASIEQVDWATWLSDVYSGRNYQTTVIALTSDYAPMDVISRYSSDADGNFINYSNDEVDSIISEIPATPDQSSKIGLYHRLLDILAEEAASCYLQDPYNIVAVSNRVTGYEVYPMYVQDMSTVHLA